MKAVVYAAAMMLAATTALAQTTEKMPAKPATMDAASNQLMEREKAMLVSLEKKDWPAFKKYVKPGTWSVDQSGYMSIDEFLKMAQDPKNALTISMTASDMKVVDVNATTKIVTYKLDQKGSFMGEAFPPVVYASTVWSNSGGTWTAVFHQESTAAPQQPKK